MPQDVADALGEWMPQFGFQKGKQRGTAQPPLVQQMRADPGIVGDFFKAVFALAATLGIVRELGNFFNFNKGLAGGAPSGWHVDHFTAPQEGMYTAARLIFYWGQVRAALAVRSATGDTTMLPVLKGTAMLATSELLSSGNWQHAHAGEGRGFSMVMELRLQEGQAFRLPVIAAAAMQAATSAQPLLRLPPFNPDTFKGDNRMWGQQGEGFTPWRNCMAHVWGPPGRGNRLMRRWEAQLIVAAMSVEEREEMSREFHPGRMGTAAAAHNLIIGPAAAAAELADLIIALPLAREARNKRRKVGAPAAAAAAAAASSSSSSSSSSSASASASVSPPFSVLNGPGSLALAYLPQRLRHAAITAKNSQAGECAPTAPPAPARPLHPAAGHTHALSPLPPPTPNFSCR
jgi:hypothetical protein